jgi:DNA repair exonuclease SbcCD ATPase subunit
MKIVSLESQNVKRLKAVRIESNGESMVVVGGYNEQGKSSVLDSIAMALGGKGQQCDQPVREGEEQAQIVCELDGDLIVELMVKPDGKRNLIVSSKAGAKYPSPQKMLDKLTGKLTFDPLMFLNLNPRQQLETVKGLVGIDLDKLDMERNKLYELRTDVGRKGKNAKGELKGCNYTFGIPDQEIDMNELIDDISNKNKENQLYEQIQLDINREELNINNMKIKIGELRNHLDASEKKLQEMNEQKLLLKQHDTSGLETLLKESQEKNKQIRDNQRYYHIEKKCKGLKAAYEDLSKKIESIDKQKITMMENANFPVDNLAFDENGLTLKGLPFEQASQAEKLRTSVAMGFAMNPKLKILLIKDGSLLDGRNLQLVKELADESGGQVWIERVGKGEECSVIIEDGEVE